MKHPCVYVMASRRNGTISTGVTASLAHRAHQHRTGATDAFTKRYACKLLAWYEHLPTMAEAIAREKHIEAGRRATNIALITTMNPDRADLCETLA